MSPRIPSIGHINTTAYPIPNEASIAQERRKMTRTFLAKLNKWIADGDVHPFYITGEWRKTRADVIEYWHGECYRCKHIKTPSELNAATMVHHVKPVKTHPELALSPFIIENGKRTIQLMPLCFDCHAAMESKAAEAEEAYPEKW